MSRIAIEKTIKRQGQLYLNINQSILRQYLQERSQVYIAAVPACLRYKQAAYTTILFETAARNHLYFFYQL